MRDNQLRRSRSVSPPPKVPRATTVKKQINPSTKTIMQRLGFSIVGLIVFGGVALALAALPSASNLPEQSTISRPSLQPSAATHETRAGLEDGLQKLIEFRNANEITLPIETVSCAPPTRSSFMATWDNVSGAKGYFLDVSTSNSF